MWFSFSTASKAAKVHAHTHTHSHRITHACTYTPPPDDSVERLHEFFANVKTGLQPKMWKQTKSNEKRWTEGNRKKRDVNEAKHRSKKKKYQGPLLLFFLLLPPRPLLLLQLLYSFSLLLNRDANLYHTRIIITNNYHFYVSGFYSHRVYLCTVITQIGTSNNSRWWF